MRASKRKYATASQLRTLMEAHDLTRARVAELLEVSPSTVDAWLAPDDADWRRSLRRRVFLQLQQLVAAAVD